MQAEKQLKTSLLGKIKMRNTMLENGINVTKINEEIAMLEQCIVINRQAISIIRDARGPDYNE